MKTKLWTIQDEKGWNELQTKGILIPKASYVWPEFIEGYDWMRAQMNKRIGKPKYKNQYPVWAWCQSIDSNKKRPDLRSSGYLPKGNIGYRIEIEKDEKDILLSDFELWHTPLAYRSFIGNSEEETIAFDRKIEDKDFNDLSKVIQNKISKSWEKIFDMNFDVPYFARPIEEKFIQATFWTLSIDEVIKVDKFIAR